MDGQQPRRRRRRSELSDAAQPFIARERENPAPPIPALGDEESQTPPDGAHRRRRVNRTENEIGAAGKNEGELFWHPESEKLKTPDNKAPKKQHGKLIRMLLAVDAVVCRLGDAILFAIEWLVIGLLFLLGFTANGTKKCANALKQLRVTKTAPISGGTRHTGKRIPRRRESGRSDAPEQKKAAVTLEPTKAQDYQGMSRKRVVRAPGRRRSVGYSAAMAALLCVAVGSTWMMGSIVWRSISTKRLNASLSQRYSELAAGSETPQPFTSDGDLFALAIQEGETPDAILFEEIEAYQEIEETPTTAPVPTATPAVQQVVQTTKYHQYGGDALPEMEALYQENRDLIGWLRMEGILDLPVMYKDNSYYLTHDFNKKQSASGTLFLDVNHPFRENAQNLLLHGHNMKDGTMFGRLVQYETNIQFLKNNPFIQYSTLWEKEQYVIFAVLHVSLDVTSEDFFNYFTHHSFTSDEQFENYVRSLQNRSVYSIPISVQPSDALLTLSTCLDEDRLVIVARRVRDGESKSELRSQVQLAAKQ